MDDARSKYCNVWTDAEVARLRELAGTMSAVRIAPLVGHTRHATLRKMYLLKLTGFSLRGRILREESERPTGTPGQQAAIRAAAGRKGPETVARELGIAPSSVRRYAARLGVELKHSAPRWTAAQDQALRGCVGQGLKAAIAATGRTEDAVVNRAIRLQVWLRKRHAVHPLGPRTRGAIKPEWTPAEIEMLRQCDGLASVEAAKRIGRGVRGVEHKAYQLGIHLRRRKAERAQKIPTAMLQPRTANPALRQVVQRGGRVEYCPQCGAPVSNWAAHFERLGHRPSYQKAS